MQPLIDILLELGGAESDNETRQHAPFIVLLDVQLDSGTTVAPSHQACLPAAGGELLNLDDSASAMASLPNSPSHHGLPPWPPRPPTISLQPPPRHIHDMVQALGV